MKFHKLSENKLKIILSNDELPNNESIDDFMSDSTEARNSFLKILDKAYVEVGFNVKNHKIKIDAVALQNGNFVFTVTKLVKTKKVLKATPKKINKNTDSDFLIYKFENFDDFYNFCEFLRKLNVKEISNLAKKTELYLYSDSYYLLIYKINENHNDIPKFYSSITEFCKYFSSKELFVSVLKEKGKLLVKNNAIKICQEKF